MIARKPWQGWALFLIAGICGLLLGIGLDQVFLRHVGHDQSWCIYAANLMLHGVPLDGRELVEVNPPFVLWFSTLPVLLAALLHIGMLNGFRIFFDAVELLSLLWTSFLFQRLFRPSRRTLLLFVLALIFTTLWLIPGDSLGQREHFLVLLLLPYLVLAAARMAMRTFPVFPAVLVGIGGGLAICLKPQHLITVIAVEVLVVLTRRSLRCLVRPEVLSFSVTLLLYALSVELFGRAYLDNVAPKLVLTYAALDVPYSVVLRSSVPVAVGILIGWGVVLSFRGRLTYPSLAKVLGVASIGSWMAYILQHKGWSYQEIPAGMLAVLFLAVTLISVAERLMPEEIPAPGTRWRSPVLVCALCCTVLSAGLDWRFGHRTDYFQMKKRELARIYAQYPEGSAVSYYAIEPWEMPLVIEQHKILGQRFNYFWMLPAIIKGQDPGGDSRKLLSSAQLRSLEVFQSNAATEDLERWKPAVVVIDECGPDLCPALRREHYNSVLGWFLQDAGFSRQWQQYKLVDKRGDLDVYQRIPSS